MKLSKVILTCWPVCISLGLAACGGGGSSSGSTPATDGGSGEQIVFKLAFNQTDQHPQYKAGVEFGKRLEEATDGRYSIKVYPNEQLGTQSDVIQNLSNGTVELMYVGGPVMEGFNKDFAVYNLPYSVQRSMRNIRSSATRNERRDLFKSAEESKNITVLAALFAGAQHLQQQAGGLQLDDLTGMKIRVQQSDSQVRMIELMGAVASPMAVATSTPRQTGVLDGAEQRDRLQRTATTKYKFYSYTRHLMIPDYLLISSKALEHFAMPRQTARLCSTWCPRSRRWRRRLPGLHQEIDRQLQVDRRAVQR